MTTATALLLIMIMMMILMVKRTGEVRRDPSLLRGKSFTPTKYTKQRFVLLLYLLLLLLFLLLILINGIRIGLFAVHVWVICIDLYTDKLFVPFIEKISMSFIANVYP